MVVTSGDGNVGMAMTIVTSAGGGGGGIPQYFGCTGVCRCFKGIVFRPFCQEQVLKVFNP